MWKLVLGFVIFAAVAVWMLSKGGDIDMGGEKLGGDDHSATQTAAPASSPAKSASTP